MRERTRRGEQQIQNNGTNKYRYIMYMTQKKYKAQQQEQSE